MKFFSCPFCGPRPQAEFHFRRAAGGVAATDFARTYLRHHDRARSLEHWQHGEGCGAWLELERNPSNGEVKSIELLRNTQR